MQYPRLIVSLAFAGSLATGAAFAQSATPSPQPAAHPQVEASGQSPHASTPGASGEASGAPAFSDLDKTGKGYITRGDVPKDNEALKGLRAHFSEADADHNGRVNAAEYNAYVNKSSAPQQN